MSIETLLQNHIEALDRNTAALLAVAGGAAVTAPAKTEAPKKAGGSSSKPKADAAAKPTKTQAEVNGALIKIKDEFGLDKAKEVLAKFKYAKMADIKEADFDALFEAAEEKYAALSDSGSTETDDDDI